MMEWYAELLMVIPSIVVFMPSSQKIFINISKPPLTLYAHWSEFPIIILWKVCCLGMSGSVSRQCSMTIDVNIVAILPLIVGQCPIDDGISWDVVTFASMNPVLQPNGMDTREEVECVPGPVGWRIVSRRHSHDSWIIQRGFVNEGIGKDGDSMDGRTII